MKTLGRPEKKGEALGGVTVRVKGEHNPVVSNNNGTFSLLLADKKNGDAYVLQQVQKNGYELNEKDLIGRQFAFSDKVPLTIVMVSSEQLQADKQRIENNAYKTAEKNYKAKYNLLEKQLADNKITAGQYREEIQDLQDKFEKYQSLIDGLAEHYAHTDYDELDEKDREINLCIENGDLERADSLIQTLFDPIGVLERNMEAIAKLDMQIGQANDIIAQANEDMAAVLKQQEKDAEYLYQLYTIALSRYDNEKALFYIETRAALDTTNLNWQLDAGYYLTQQNQIVQAESYYSNALLLCHEKAKDNPHTYEKELVNTLNNLGLIYCNTNRTQKGENMLLNALNISKDISENDPQFNGMVIQISANLGFLYFNTNRLSEWGSLLEDSYERLVFVVSNPQWLSKDNMNSIISCINQSIQLILKTPYIDEAQIEGLANYTVEMEKGLKELIEDEPIFLVPYADLLGNTAKLFSCIGRKSESESLFQEATIICRKLAETNPEAYDPTLADALTQLGIYYYLTQQFSQSKSLLKEAISIHERIEIRSPYVFEPSKAFTLGALADLYLSIGCISESESLYLQMLDIYRRMPCNQRQESLIASTSCSLASIYAGSQRFQESDSLYMETLETYRKLANESPELYQSVLAETIIDYANFCALTQQFHKSEHLYKEALDMSRSLVNLSSVDLNNDPLLAAALKELAIFYYYNQRYSESEPLLVEALEIGQRLVKTNPKDYEPFVATVFNALGSIYRDTQRYNESEQMLSESIRIGRHLVNDVSESYLASLIQDLLDFAHLKVYENQFQEAITIAEECIRLTKSMNEKDNNSLRLLGSSLQLAGDLYSDENNHLHAYQCYQELLPLLKTYFKDEENELWQESIVNILGSQSFHAIFLQKYDEAEQYSIEALSFDPSQYWINTNLAASLLLQGKYNDAEAIYRQYKDELKDNFLQDIIEFEAASVIPEERKADVERIKIMLNE